MDSAYLKEHVGKALALGLAEVCQKKPADPIEYLSKWLRKHVENLKDDANVCFDYTFLLFGKLDNKHYTVFFGF